MLKAIASGLAGACAVTLMNETIRQVDEGAPRLDVLGMRALSKVTDGDHLRAKAMGSDIVANTLYYAIVAAGPAEKAPLCGLAMGFGAGLGAVALPGHMGLGNDTTNRDTKRRVLSVVYYTTAGLFAGMLFQKLASRE